MLTKHEENRYNNLCLFGVIFMQINIRDIATKKNLVQLKETIDVTDLLKIRKDIIGSESLYMDGQAKYVAGIIEVTGELTLPIEFICSRCLSQFCQKLHFPFKEVFTQNADQIDKEDDAVHLVSEDKVDLNPYVEENVFLGIPYIPICEENCKGLSPTTGLNLNIYPSEHKEERIDPRLAALADFFNKE